MKDRRLEIKEALESMKAAERAADFEDLAGHIAKRRWPELVITERKKDGAEDLTTFSPGKDGKTRRGAISLTGTWAKVQADALGQRSLKTDVLVFITSEPLTNRVVRKWCEKFKQKFGHELEVLGQAELISELEKPENDWLCVRYLRLEPHQPDLKRLQNLLPPLRPYLLRLAEDCQLVTLLGIDPQVGDVTEGNTPELAKVYIHLNTTEVRTRSEKAVAKPRAGSPMPGTERETEPLPAVEAIFGHDRSVFLGAPGSGKTTLFRYLAFCLARHHADDKRDYLVELPVGLRSGSPPVPVWVELRRLAAACKDQTPSAGDSCHVWDYLQAGLEKRNLGASIPALKAALLHGHALVLLDGLDEVPDGQRAFIRQAIESFATGGFRASRMVVTCRVKSYVPRGLQLKGFSHIFTLAEFTPAQSQQFVQGWYGECARKGYQGMTAEDAAKCSPSLVRALDQPRLQEMGRNPMHLTAMACLHTARAGEPLPEESAKLFDLLVNTLLFLWAKAKVKGATESDAAQDELGALLKDGDCSEKKLRACLARLAFQAHQAAAATQAGDWTPANITEDKLAIEFARLDSKGQRLAWAGKVIEAIRHRAGLLQSEDGKSFQFTYRFQEFLAGDYLADKDAWERDHQQKEARGQMPTFAQRAAALFDPAGYWRNVITWAAGIRAHVKGDLGDVRDLVHELCQVPAQPDALARRQLVFAADVVREVRFCDLLELSWGSDTVADLRQRLLSLLQSTTPAKEFPLKERAGVAGQLGWVQDPREGVGTVPRPGKKDRPNLLWTPGIEPGDFIMGGSGDWEGKLQFTHRLQHPFCVAAYPVTAAQFELFIQDEGYAREELWTKAGWQWRNKEERTRPDDYASAFQTPNHPRVGVTWYEAMAFCKWLNATFKPEELNLPGGWKVRLPSEAEWERAARHTDGRDSPWDPKDKAEPASRCNCAEAEIGQTSAVGLFPSGQAVCGAADMAGNVWEWCLTKWCANYKNYEKLADQGPEGDSARVLRGGSWVSDADIARCAFRVRYNPGSRYWFIGFRVVASPFFALNSDPSEL